MNWGKIFEELMAVAKPCEHFLDYFSELEKPQVMRVFDELKIPLPEKGNFLSGIEGGLIFHTDSGVVIRAEAKNSRFYTIKPYEILCRELKLDFSIIKAHLKHVIPVRLVHDHILQPIASIETENHVIEIVPGGKMGVSDADLEKMKKALAKDGINFWDGDSATNNPQRRQIAAGLKRMGINNAEDMVNQGKSNSTYLSVRTPEFPNGFPVIADRLAGGWVPLFHDPGSLVAKLLGRASKASKTPVQDRLFGHLKRAFAEAWPDHSKPADPAKMEKFWEECTRAAHTTTETGEPLLNASWVKIVENGMDHGKNSEAAQVAGRYADQLHRGRS